MIEKSLKVSTAFTRKFELVSGWNTLKTVLPQSWAPGVQTAVFDVLLGGGYSAQSTDLVVVCPQMLPVILACLRYQLEIMSGTHIGHDFLCKSRGHYSIAYDLTLI